MANISHCKHSILYKHGRDRLYCRSCGKTVSTTVSHLYRLRSRIDALSKVSVDIEFPSSRLWLDKRGRPCIQIGKGHPYANSGGWQYLSRFVAQYTTGERLRPDEHVHHTDGRFTNCRRDNLEVWLSERHGRFHARHQLLYMLRDRVTGRFMKSLVPPFSGQISNQHDSHNGLDEIPF